jgi:hypothetical protein
VVPRTRRGRDSGVAGRGRGRGEGAELLLDDGVEARLRRRWVRGGKVVVGALGRRVCGRRRGLGVARQRCRQERKWRRGGVAAPWLGAEQAVAARFL